MKKVLLLHIMIAASTASNTVRPCHPVQFEYGINCKCTEKYCDTLYVPEPKCGNQFIFITSSKGGERFSYIIGSFLSYYSKIRSESNTLHINQEKKYKRSKIIGFGGAISDAVTYVLSGMSPELRKNVYRSYFSPKDGIGYNLIRVPIGCSDFSLKTWTYDNQTKRDPMLEHFKKLNENDVVRNNYIKEMRQFNDLKVIATAWTPPLWMKAKHNLNGSTDNQLIPECYQTWADYHAKWINLMEKDGVKIWAITTGNEPMYAVNQASNFPALSWDPGNQAEWIVDHLVPTLEESDNSDVKIGFVDDIRLNAIEYLEKMRERRSDVMKFSDFICFHAYADNSTSPRIVDIVHHTYGKPILYTENASGFLLPTLLPGSWLFVEELVQNLMQILQNNVVGYIDWNMVLDSKGGPCYRGSHSNAYIFANEDFSAFYKQPLYYGMAHFAKFITPQSVRIDATIVGPMAPHVLTIAYLRPDNMVTAILYNNQTESVSLTVVDALKGKAHLLLEPKSLSTLIYSTVDHCH